MAVQNGDVAEFLASHQARGANEAPETLLIGKKEGMRKGAIAGAGTGVGAGVCARGAVKWGMPAP